eukprot:722402-Prymnesium_polylepis.1
MFSAEEPPFLVREHSAYGVSQLLCQAAMLSLATWGPFCADVTPSEPHLLVWQARFLGHRLQLFAGRARLAMKVTEPDSLEVKSFLLSAQVDDDIRHLVPGHGEREAASILSGDLQNTSSLIRCRSH